MDYKKNDQVTVTIEDMGHDGEGIGKIEGYTLFIKDGVIGDTVRAKIMKAKKSYAYARLEKIIAPSPFREEPRCFCARQCGGCQLQALNYKKQLEFKKNKVCNNLRRIGGFSSVPLDEVIGMDEPFRYRNKAQYPVGYDREGNLVAGFYAGRTHSIIPNRDCLLGVEANREILDVILEYMTEYKVSAYREETGQGLVRHILLRYGFSTKEIMVCLVVNGRKLPREEELIKRLAGIDGMVSITLNENRERTNVILGHDLRCLWGRPYIIDYIGDVKYQISPLSFYQVNPVQTRNMYEKALAYADLKGNEIVWDLYCGIGTISLFLAKKAKHVHGVEIVPEAIADARKNAELNGIRNASFYVGRAEEVLPEEYEKNGIRADVIVVDPPRKGCDEKLLSTIAAMEPERVVYVSCDSATLARDLKWLCERGYELQKVSVVDNFCQTVHVECVTLLQKSNRKLM